MALRDNFKDALDDIVNMFDNPKAQKVIGALSSSVQPASQGRVAENLSVPFGASFDQGQALRGSAQQIDAQTDARVAAERQAQLEAQRVALEGRRVSTEEKATQHAMDKDVLSDKEEHNLDSASKTEIANLEIEARKDAEKEKFNNDKELAKFSAGLDMDNYKAKTQQEQNSPMYKAQVKEVEANIELTLAQTVEKNANIELGKAKGIMTKFNESLNGAEPTPLQRAQTRKIYQEIYENSINLLAETAGPDVDLEASSNALGLSVFMEGYKQNAVGVDAFRQFLPPVEMEKMYQLDAAWRRAVANNDFEAYYALQEYVEYDMADDKSLNNSVLGSSFEKELAQTGATEFDFSGASNPKGFSIDPFSTAGQGMFRPPSKPSGPVPGSSLKLPPAVEAERKRIADAKAADAARAATAASMPKPHSGKAEEQQRLLQKYREEVQAIREKYRASGNAGGTANVHGK